MSVQGRVTDPVIFRFKYEDVLGGFMSWIVWCAVGYAVLFIVGHWFFRIQLVKSLGNAEPLRKR